MPSAAVSEVWSGIQGEGIRVGKRQVFIRFAGCNLACRYCDTPESRLPSPAAEIEEEPGARRFECLPNPIAADALAERVRRLDPDRRHDSVALTGGEPLLAADFLRHFIPLCNGRLFYLETNGSLPDALEAVIDLVHVVAMDIKLPSATGQALDAEAARRFLEIAGRRDAFVKVVVTGAASPGELCEAIENIVVPVNVQVPLVIQPVTAVAADVLPTTPGQILALQMAALGVLPDVRVIPQVHRLMGQK